MFNFLKRPLSDEQKGIVALEVAMLMRRWEEEFKKPITQPDIDALARAALEHKKLKFNNRDLFEIGVLALATPTKIADQLRKDLTKK